MVSASDDDTSSFRGPVVFHSGVKKKPPNDLMDWSILGVVRCALSPKGQPDI